MWRFINMRIDWLIDCRHYSVLSPRWLPNRPCQRSKGGTAVPPHRQRSRGDVGTCTWQVQSLSADKHNFGRCGCNERRALWRPAALVAGCIDQYCLCSAVGHSLLTGCAGMPSAMRFGRWWAASHVGSMRVCSVKLTAYIRHVFHHEQRLPVQWYIVKNNSKLTPSTPAVPNCCCSNGSAPY